MKNMKRFFILCCLLILVYVSKGLFAQDTIPGDEYTFNLNSTITIDNDFSDWEGIQEIARFYSYYNPYYYNQEVNGNAEQKKIEDSFYWGYNGTRLKEIKAAIESNTLYFYFSTYSPIAEGLILFFYLYQYRDRNTINLYTLEMTIDIDSHSGKIFLWDATREEIIEAGTVAVSPRSLECAIHIDAFPQALQTIFITRYSCDLTTCFYEKSSGLYEEFYFTTIYFKDIPALE